MTKRIPGLGKAVVVLSILTAMGGCKIQISMPQGIPGWVAAQSASTWCLRLDDGSLDEDSVCEADVVDTTFDETFIAVPAGGYVFSGWKKDHRHLCGGSRKPCSLSTAGFAGNDALMAFLRDDDEVFFLEPVFTPGEVALAGDYEGAWTNVTFETSGAISLAIVDNADDTFDITIDLDGNVLGQGDPGPVTIVAEVLPSGLIRAFGELDIAGVAAPYRLEIDTEAAVTVVTFDIPELPIVGFRSLEVFGIINGGTGYLEYKLTLAGTDEAVGTIAIYKP